MHSSTTPIDTDIPDVLRSQYAAYFQSPQAGQLFQNTWPHPKLATVRDVLRWKFGSNTVRSEGYRVRPIQSPANGLADVAKLPRDATRIFWIGHASFLFEMDGQRIVVDPIFGRAAVVTPRVTKAAANAEQLGHIDAVLITHGHHDHLDPSSVAAIAQANDGRTLFVVPMGMARTLPRACKNVVELSWWQHVPIGPVRAHLVPAQHWHQRSALDRNKTLWGGYVVEGTHRIYHSGDTGYFGGFGAIGQVFGGVDAACLPLGAYEPTWFMAVQHMSPSQSLQAYKDLGATHFVGMHWGAFDLSDEELDAGPRWLLEALREQRLTRDRFQVLQPGGSVGLTGARGDTRAIAQHLYEPA